MEPPQKKEMQQEEKPSNTQVRPHVSKKTIRFYLIGVLLALIIFLFLIGFFPRQALWKEVKTLAANDEFLTVSVLSVKSEKKPVALVLPSTTNAIRFTPIWARVDGYLENFFADIGDHVKVGQLLATIDTPEIDKQLLQARADLLYAFAQLEIAAISANRWNKLYQINPEAIPKQEVDERDATFNSSEASVKSNQANVERLEKLQGFKHIIAPFSGIITQRDIDVGSLITAGSAGNPQQLFYLAKTDIIRVFVNVPQYFYRLIKEGLTADINIQEFPGRSFKGIVTRTAGALDPIARTLLTEIHIDNRDGTLTTGLYANVTFMLTPEFDFFVVPTNSAIIINAGPKIAVVDDLNVIKMIPVTLGKDFGKTIEITSGLKENDKIVLNPTEKIREGVKVQIR